MPVRLAELLREDVEVLGQLPDARRDLLGRRRVDRARARPHVVVELSEVDCVARLRGEEGLLDPPEELLEGPQRLGPLGKANVVFVKKLVRMSDFAAMNAVYPRRFGNHRPARSTVAVAELPKDAAVEIDVVARSKV